MNDKMQDLSKALLGLHVKDVFNKNEDGLRLRELTDEDKQRMRDLFTSLEQQVNDFVNKTKSNENEVEQLQAKAKTRTTLRDKLRNKK